MPKFAALFIYMSFLKRQSALITVLTLVAASAMGQSSQSLYLFHWNPFKQVQANIPTNKRRPRTCVEGGLVFGFFKNDPHYTNSTQAKAGYIIGVKEEFPVSPRSYITAGFDFCKQGMSFNSYYFAKGYSFLYIPSEEYYNHVLSINELHIPVEYRFSFKNESKNIRTFYGLFGWVYRLLIYDNALVTNTQNGQFVYEGQKNLIYKYSLFTPTGSAIAELGLGYQRNGLKNGNSFYFEMDYKYGVSPIIYSGNGTSNNVTFTLNTFTLKVGLRI